MKGPRLITFIEQAARSQPMVATIGKVRLTRSLAGLKLRNGHAAGSFNRLERGNGLVIELEQERDDTVRILGQVIVAS